MARRKKNDLADAVVGATALLPWWAGVALAVVSYLLLHSFAQKPLTMALQPGQAGSFAATAMWHVFATIGQYFLLVLFLLGAGISAYQRLQPPRQRQAVLCAARRWCCDRLANLERRNA